MANSVALFMLMVVLVLLSWFGSPTFGQFGPETTTLPCFQRLTEGSCSNETDPADTKALDRCCSAIEVEIRTDEECMCTVFNSNLTLAAEDLASCSINKFDLATCQVYLLPPSPPPSDSFPTPADSTTPSDSFEAQASGTNTTLIVAIVVPIVVIVALIIVIVLICVCKGKQTINPNDNIPHNGYVEVTKDLGLNSQSVSVDLPPLATPPVSKVPQASPATNKLDFTTDDSLQYDLATLQIATNDFSNDNVIGRGGFGFVYKGIFSSGREIAVKRLSHASGQGDKEFRAEIELLAKLQHRNMVRLLGFCLADNEALLVYELVPNKSLDYFLFDSKKREELTWPIRFGIIRGIARGMLYLHEDCPLRTIHRDMKAGNVLLDEKMNPKIADFGLARICANEQTHVDATRVVGTRGYMSPEYLLYGQFSVKSDVYAFGVLVLEIISGTRVGNGPKLQSGGQSENLMTFAWRCWGEEKPLELVDPCIKDSYSSDEVLKCVHLGLLCVQDDVNKRPGMSEIVHMLSSYNYSGVAANLPSPQFPGFLFNTGSDQSTTSVSSQYVNNGNSGGSNSTSPLRGANAVDSLMLNRN